MEGTRTHPSLSPGIAVRRTASLSLAYDRAIQYSRALVIGPNRRGVLDTPLSRGMTIGFVALIFIFQIASDWQKAIDECKF